MNKYISLITLLFILAACGTSKEEPATSSTEPEKSPYADYPMLVEGCPEQIVEGQTFEDLSDEEKEKYGTLEPLPGISEEELQHSSMKRAHKNYVNKQLIEAGFEEGVGEVKNIGTLSRSKGTLVIQLKETVPEEQKDLKQAVIQAVEETKEYFNKGAVYVEEVEYSYEELVDAQTRLVTNLQEKRSSLEGKVGAIGTCIESNMLTMEIRMELTDEQYQFINDATDVKMVMSHRPYTKATGYVTKVREDSFFFDMTYYEHEGHDVEVGDSVTVSHGNVKLSWPGGADAVEVEIHEPEQPDGADLTDKIAVQQGLNQLGDVKGHLTIEDVSYEEDSDQWIIQVMHHRDMDNREEKRVEVSDQ